MSKRYLYYARVVNVIDGDSLRVDVDLGLSIWSRQVLRLAGVNTPEVIGATAVAGKVAKEALANLLRDKVILIETFKDKKEKFGRYLCDVYVDGVDPVWVNSVNQWLLDQGLAVPYDGGKR